MFGELARDSLKSNSELFLQLARERLGRQQQDAAAALKERETAIESLVQPIREALARPRLRFESIERERIDSFATIKSQMEAWRAAKPAVARDPQSGDGAAPAGRARALGRDHAEAPGGAVRHERARRFHANSDTMSTDAGPIRPDMIVHMPERRDIVVDVKTPLDAYLAAVEAQTTRSAPRAQAPRTDGRRARA